MKMTSGAHNHSTWCDGASTIEEMAEGALLAGYTDLGFSGHSPAPFDPNCPGISDEDGYITDVRNMAQQYAGRLNIVCGVEQDAFAPVQREKYDYIISSVHYLKNSAGGIRTIDGGPGNIPLLRDEWYGGDELALAQAFFQESVDAVNRYKPEIVGHFDLILKYNKDVPVFDEESAAYRNLALEYTDMLADAVLTYGGVVEVNTGASGRGLRMVPYPAPYLLQHLAQRGVRVMINSDCHNAQFITRGYEQALSLVQSAGFKSIASLRNRKFVDENL